MPGLTLPTLSYAEVKSHNSKKSCYVTIGTKVYDLTSFLDDHPGGAELILDWAGKDVEKILKDEISHLHSEAAYEILDESLIGFVATNSVMKDAVKSSHPDEIVPLPKSQDGSARIREEGVQEDLNQRPVFEATGMSSA